MPRARSREVGCQSHLMDIQSSNHFPTRDFDGSTHASRLLSTSLLAAMTLASRLVLKPRLFVCEWSDFRQMTRYRLPLDVA